MGKPPRIDRKDLKTPDQFMRSGQGLLAFLVRRKAPFLNVAVVAGIVVAAVYAYEWWDNRHLNKAWEAYRIAMSQTEPKRTDDLKTLHGIYGKSRAGFYAALALADHFSKESASKKDAVDWYTKALSRNNLLPLEKQLLYVDRGQVHEAMGSLDLALEDYRKATEITGEARGYGFLSVARALEQKGELTQAADTYQKVSIEFLNTEYAKIAKTNLHRLKSPLLKKTAPKT